MLPLHVVLYVIAAGVWRVSCEPQSPSSPATALSSTAPVPADSFPDGSNHTLTVGSRIYSIVNDLPTLKNIVVFMCAFTGFLIVCLVVRVYRSGRKIRKTRKYDIITTPAERVEMAPLNDENDEEDESALFDVKYR